MAAKLLQMPLMIVPLVALSLTACDTEVGTVVARESARSVVNDVVESRFPGVPVSPVTDCIIDNATGAEILSIAGDTLDRTPSTQSVQLIIEIAQRQDTVTCFVKDAGPLVMPAILSGLA